MRIEILVIAGCPSFPGTLENVRDALRLEGLPEVVEVAWIQDEAEAKSKGMIGSPTVLVEGVDIARLRTRPEQCGFGCRIYDTGSCLLGTPPLEWIRLAIRRETNKPDQDQEALAT